MNYKGVVFIHSKCSCKTTTTPAKAVITDISENFDDNDNKCADFAKSEEAFDAEIEGVLFDSRCVMILGEFVNPHIRIRQMLFPLDYL